MRLVNETGIKVAYWIQSPSHGAECGDIDVNGYVDTPSFDDQTDVYVGFKPTGGHTAFSINCPQTGKVGQASQVKMQIVVV